jgi:hypothetical protein
MASQGHLAQRLRNPSPKELERPNAELNAWRDKLTLLQRLTCTTPLCKFKGPKNLCSVIDKGDINSRLVVLPSCKESLEY